jgi:hypothetical protein
MNDITFPGRPELKFQVLDQNEWWLEDPDTGEQIEAPHRYVICVENTATQRFQTMVIPDEIARDAVALSTACDRLIAELDGLEP